MGTINTTSTLTGLFKESYGDSVIGLVPTEAPLCSMVGMEVKSLLGNKYHQPVDVTLEQGFTCAAANAGAVTLLNPSNGVMQDAQIEGAQLIGRAQVDYESIARSASGGSRAFLAATKQVVKRLAKSGAKRLETQFLHGRRGLGIISVVSGSSTTRTWTISDESWSAGIWAGSVGATLDVCEPSDYSTKINTNAAVTVTSISVANKQVLVSGNATDLTAIEALDIIFYETASATTEMAGLDHWTRNTGTLFNVAGATYELWQGNIYSTSTGVISMGKILEAVGATASYGGNKPVVAVVAPRAFEVLNSDQAALRQYDVSFEKTGKNGFRALKYAGQTGDITILPHYLQKDGLCHIFCPEEALRIGAQDLSFIKRHGSEEALILENSTTSGAEMRVYSNQALLVEAPRHTVVMAGITY